MATLIPSIGACASRMTGGERRLAYQQTIPSQSPHAFDEMVDPSTIRLSTLRDEAFAIADHLGQAHQEGHAWGDMAILCADWKTMDLCADALAQRKLPFNVRKRSGDFNPGANAIQVMTMKVSKGLEFPVVALPGMGHTPAAGEDEKEAARVFYVAATWATQRLGVGVGGDGGFGSKLNCC